MTDPELARRAATLADRSRTRSATKVRRHPAGASRIVAAGLSATALFGLIAALTLSAPATTAAVSQPVAAATPPPPPEQIVVIVHRKVPLPVATGPTPSSGASSAGTASGRSAPRAAPAAAVPAPTAAAPSPRPTPVTTTKSS